MISYSMRLRDIWRRSAVVPHNLKSDFEPNISHEMEKCHKNGQTHPRYHIEKFRAGISNVNFFEW
jgi:hypothetical protein